ncbi:MAG: hypothetical protein ACE5EF_00135 [Dehalococcoidia bacterium]
MSILEHLLKQQFARALDTERRHVRGVFDWTTTRELDDREFEIAHTLGDIPSSVLCIGGEATPSITWTDAQRERWTESSIVVQVEMAPLLGELTGAVSNATSSVTLTPSWFPDRPASELYTAFALRSNLGTGAIPQLRLTWRYSGADAVHPPYDAAVVGTVDGTSVGVDVPFVAMVRWRAPAGTVFRLWAS